MEMSFFAYFAGIWVLCLIGVILYFAIEEFRSWSKHLFVLAATLFLFAAHCSLLASYALAAGPYLVCAPPSAYTVPTGDTLSYNVAGLPSAIAATNIGPDSTGTYAFALSLSGIAAGSYTVTAQSCVNDAIWGQACSAQSAPFSFTVPAAPPVPTALKISTTQ
jgi:hypothetical protein